MSRLSVALRPYLKATPAPVIAIDLLRVLAIVSAPVLASVFLHWTATTDLFVAPIHRRFHANPDYFWAGRFYWASIALGFAINAAWLLRAARNFVTITLVRSARSTKPVEETRLALPPWPYNRESFAVILGELQDRDGSRVPNERARDLKPRWLILPELALYTGVFVTGGIGSGKTSAIAYPALRQLLGFRRSVKVRRKDGSVHEQPWMFSGLIMDEKGDFTRAASQYAEEWGRADDIIRIAPGGNWIWNVIYNPNLPTWAVAYQLGWILKNFNKGAAGGDPFWENAPKELVTDYLGLLDDALGYYTLFDYLETLVDDSRQDKLNDQAMRRFAGDARKVDEMERRWKTVQKRRDDMSVNLRGALEACAKAGIDMFRFPELRRTFCPTKEEYFEHDPQQNVLRPKPNVFTGFDQILDYGKIVGLEMPKQVYFDAAIFIQVALKSQWQDSVLRREGIGPDGKPLLPPRFGERIGYCPTFLMADEAQQNATPKDAEFKAVCRSKRASMWELTQSHGSIKGAFGPSNAAHAATYFQNSMTHIYLRQSDLDSMKIIQEECGKKVVQKTSLSVSEGGAASELSYFQGEMVHGSIGISSTKTVATEEKPFLEVDELKQLPNNVAVILPSNGDRTLAATVTYLRPLWIRKKYPDLPIETPWLDWPQQLRTTYDLDNIPQELSWKGWDVGGPLDEEGVVEIGERLGRFVQASIDEPPTSAPPADPDRPNPEKQLDAALAAPGPTGAPSAKGESTTLEVEQLREIELPDSLAEEHADHHMGVEQPSAHPDNPFEGLPDE